MNGRITALFILFSFLLLIVPSAEASGMGIGISGRSEVLTITKFPFTHEGSFSIHNTCDFDCFYELEAYSPYADVGEWIKITPRTVSIASGNYGDIRYTLTAQNGYSGSYEIRIIAKGYGMDEPQSSGDKPVSYVQTSGSIKLSVTVTDEAGASSLGTQRPVSTEPAGGEGTEAPQEGIEMVTLDTPAYLDVPATCMMREPVHICGGLVSGYAPTGMHICLYSPSGNEYRLPPDYTYSFTEPGIWTATLSLGDMVLMANEIMVERPQSGNAPYLLASLAVCCTILVAAIVRKPKP